jgi:hypothetical protein
MELLRHGTGDDILFKILQDGYLSTPQFRGEKSTSHFTNIIFFTPVSEEWFVKSKQNDYALYLDFKALLNDYPQYFINISNAYGPHSGKKTSSGSCKCRYTFYSKELMDEKKIKPIFDDEGGCGVKTQDEMLDIIQTVYTKIKSPEEIFDYCDAGPEVGVYTPDGKIPLKKYLKYITFKPRNSLSDYTKKRFTNEQLNDMYKKFANPNLKGGKKQTHKRKRFRKNKRHTKKVLIR